MIPSAHSFLAALLIGVSVLAQAPPGPTWSTYLGGNGTDRANVHSVRVMPNGHVLVVGTTDSTNFPVKNALQPVFGGINLVGDGFVACFDPSASGNSQLVWSTYLGGIQDDEVYGLTVAPNGDVVVCGWTDSTNFPTTPGCYQPQLAGGPDIFAARLSWNGQALSLVWSTLLGAAGNDWANAVALQGNGDVVLGGVTTSPGFPMVGTPRQPAHGGGIYDGVLAVLTANGTGLLSSTFHGDSGSDVVRSLVLDNAGMLYVGGSTDSPNFPVTAGAFQPTPNGALDGYVSCFGPALGTLAYSTYLGGSLADGLYGLGLTSTGQIAVAGYTQSRNYPATNGTGFGGGQWDGFVSILDPTATGAAQLSWSTYFGRSGNEWIHDLAVDTSDLITVVGPTNSPNLLVTPGAHGTTFRGGAWDVFVAQFDPQRRTGIETLYTSYYGGSNSDQPLALDLDSQGDPVFAGLTDSPPPAFPVTPGAYQQTLGGGSCDAFVSELPLLPAGATRYGVATPGCHPPVRIGVNTAPAAGNGWFTIFASGAQPSTAAFLIFGWPVMPPIPLLNASISVNIPVLAANFTVGDPSGFVQMGVALPVTPPPPYGIGVQWLFPGCTNTTITASEAVGL